MPDKKQNPLIGAFRDAAPSPPPDPPAAGEKKGPSRSKSRWTLNRPKCLNPPIPLIQKRCQRRRMPTPRLKGRFQQGHGR